MTPILRQDSVRNFPADMFSRSAIFKKPFIMSVSLAIVAGVGPGIGRSISLKLAKSGCHVVMLARSTAFMEQVANEIESTTNSKSTTISCDLSSKSSIESAMVKIEKIGADMGLCFGQ
jgi:short-subunit dehydrogenase